MSLKWKQIILYLVTGLVPLAAVMVMSNVSFKEIRNLNASSLQGVAENIADKVDRNLFERYGDVQAFGLNSVLRNQDYWYRKDSPIVTAMNNYVDTYDIYYLTLLADLEGNVIAVNSRDQDGKAISTQDLYSLNFQNASWFKDVLQKKFYTSQEGNVGGGSDFTGTVIVPLHIDGEVKQAYPGDDGLTVGFAAPVYDAAGNVLAIWHNYAKFSLVEDIFAAAYQGLKQKNMGGIELTLLNGDGQVIVDYDPRYGRGTEHAVKRDLKTILHLNLVEKGVAAAVAAAKDKKSGFEYATHARKGIVQAAGYAHFQGALGFPGMNWSVLARMPDTEVNAPIISIESKLFKITGVCMVLIALFGYWNAQRLTRPLIVLTDGLENFAAGNMKNIKDLAVRSQDEIGRLSQSFNGLFRGIKIFLKNAEGLLQGNIPETENFGLRGEFEDNLRKMRTQAAEKKKADEEAAKVMAIVENMPQNVMYADKDLKIQYINPSSTNTLKTLQQYLPVPVDKMLGQCIDVFHKNPQHQRKLLSDPKNLPHTAQIQMGPEILSLTVAAIFDQNGERLGTMLVWVVVTQNVKTERQAREAAEREQAQADELREMVDTMLEVVNAAAEGDLTREVTVRGDDAIGKMGEGLANFFAKLRNIISSIGENAQTLTSSAGQLNEVSQQMAGNAEETSAQANVVSAASEQVTKNVQTVATGSEEMSASIKEIAQNSSEAAKVATAAVKVAEKTNNTVKKLGESSAEVGQVIKVITSIAEQTNLLALNATIEAA
ncbi:MAG: HAMP domain-containing protein, partial [Nitrospinaceae bacterium]